MDKAVAPPEFPSAYQDAGKSLEKSRHLGIAASFEIRPKSSSPFAPHPLTHSGIFGRNRAELRVGEDQDVLLRALEVISPDEVAFFSQIGYEYRENPGGVCKRRWKEVLRNYLATMLQGAKRRGGAFTGCRFGGVRSMDGGTIDCYEYRDRNNIWWGWEEWRRRTDASSEASN